jgi:hypothetical protein
VPSADDYVKDPLRLPPHLSQVLLNSPASPVDPHTLPTPSHVVLNHLYVLGAGPAPSMSPSLHSSSSSSTTSSNAAIVGNDALMSGTAGKGQTIASSTTSSTSKEVGDGNVLVTGITQKFKLKAFASLTPKFVTTVYYSPKS